MSDTYGIEYYDDNPSKYVDALYKRARQWFDAHRPALQEQWDMWMGLDAYINERRATGHAALSFPLIFASTESIFATVYEILQAHESLLQFEARMPGDMFGKIAAERLQSGFQNVRADLDWDSKILDLIVLTTVMDWGHVHLEPETIPIEPHMGVVAGPEMYGTEKLYPSWNVYPPGRIIWDGSYERDDQAPAYFKLRFESYQWVAQRWPDKVGQWLKSKETSAADSDFFSPGTAHPSYTTGGLAKLYDGASGSPAGQEGVRRGYVIVEAHVNACFKDGHMEQRVYTYMPDVTPDESVATDSNDVRGYMLEEGPRAFESLTSMQRTCRSRRVPLSNRGIGTAGRLVPFQRQFSAQVSMEADMDMLAIAPPILYRAGAFVGAESISFDPYNANPVNFDNMPPGTSMDQMVQQMKFNQTGRAWASDTKNTLRNIMDLVSGAFESATGDVGENDERLGKSQMRAAGGQRRIMTQFVEHAASLIWIMNSTLRMMREAPTQFLYPPIMANSETLGRPGIITIQDTMAAVKAKVPALSEYAAKQQEKIIWRMVGDGFAQIPLFAESMELQAWYIEKMIRAMRVPEMDVQEAMAAARQGIMEAKMMQMASVMAPEVDGSTGGGKKANPPGGSSVGPPGVAQAMPQEMAA